jgi:hypothetical protein
MSGANISAYGIYQDESTVNDAVQAFKSSGFRDTDISILLPENLGSKDFAHEKHSKAPEGAVAGGGSGAVIGAAAGWLAGMGSIMLPGLEAIAAVGPVLGMFSGMGVGVLAGGLTGAIAGAAIPEYEAKRFSGRVRKGGILLSIHCDNATWARKAKDLLKTTGARHIAAASEARADFATSQKPLPRGRVTSSV